MFVNDKHSSLFRCIVNDDGKIVVTLKPESHETLTNLSDVITIDQLKHMQPFFSLPRLKMVEKLFLLGCKDFMGV